MSSAHRAIFGALFGALLVLLVHPASRVYLTHGLTHFGPSTALTNSRALPENIATLPDPQAPITGAYSVLVAADRLINNEKLTDDQLLLMIEVCQAASEAEPENSFWRLMESVFHEVAGNREAALKSWRLAALGNDYNDYQIPRLELLIFELQKEDRASLAWHTGTAIKKKTNAAARAIANEAQAILGEDLRKKDYAGLVSTLQNAKLLRDGSRSLPGARIGSDIIAIVPNGKLGVSKSPKTMVEERNYFLTKLSTEGLDHEYRTAAEVFSNDDGWEALIPPDSDALLEQRLRRSILTGNLAGNLLLCSAVALLIALTGWLVIKKQDGQTTLTTRILPVIGIVLGVLVYIATHLAFPAIWVTVVFAGFALAPPRIMPATPKNLGFTLNLIQGLLAGASSCLFVAYLLVNSTAAYSLRGHLGFTGSFQPGSPDLLAWSILVFSLSLCASQVWAFINRRRSLPVAALGLVRFGLTSAISCLVIGLAATPLLLAWDQEIADDFQKLFLNEPRYYINLTSS